MEKKKYATDGRWYRATEFESCCDCGLCHKKEYKVMIKEDGTPIIYFRAWRDKDRTEQNRKDLKIKL